MSKPNLINETRTKRNSVLDVGWLRGLGRRAGEGVGSGGLGGLGRLASRSSTDMHTGKTHKFTPMRWSELYAFDTEPGILVKHV